MLSEKSLSVKSSLLDDEMLEEKRKKERFALMVGVLAQLMWAVNSIQLKSYRKFFPDHFSNNSLVLWRSAPIWGLGYYFAKKKNIRIIPFKEIKHKFWFFFRSFGNYLTFIVWVCMLHCFRVSTCQCVSGCYPIVVLYLSVCILKETFYIRYLAGVFFCFLGTVIIVMNEKKTQGQEVQNNNLFLGCILASLHLFLNSFSNFGQKILCKQNISGDLQNYYLGMLNTLPALVVVTIEWHSGLSNILYVLYGMSNGLVFYTANYLTAVALDNIAISKFNPITYMRIVFVFILGFIFFHEKVYFTDVIGSILILGFQVYNVWVPVGKN